MEKTPFKDLSKAIKKSQLRKHLVTYTVMKLLPCTSEDNILLYINLITIKEVHMQIANKYVIKCSTSSPPWKCLLKPHFDRTTYPPRARIRHQEGEGSARAPAHGSPPGLVSVHMCTNTLWTTFRVVSLKAVTSISSWHRKKNTDTCSPKTG